MAKLSPDDNDSYAAAASIIEDGSGNPEASEVHETTHQELARNTSHGMFVHLAAIAAEITRSDDLEALVSKTVDRCRRTQAGVAITAEYLFVKEHFTACSSRHDREADTLKVLSA
jgi:hypothetical protein